jgi:glycosyltransferase involved in cell wall biosynthesis
MLFDEVLAYPNTYESTFSRINDFTQTNSDALITFVIPSINRATLSRTLNSILRQTKSNWKAIIVFDGCEPTDESLLSLLQDSRFLYVPIKRTGSQENIFHGQAGFVRNIGMQFVHTPWIGFIDDDDVIIPTYMERFEEELQITPYADVISFKMICDSEIFPPVNYPHITQNTIGISFTMKSSLIKEGFGFKQSTSEDFGLLNDLQHAQKAIVLSPFITYLVRDAPFMENVYSERFVIHAKSD